jgi:hypothetical protein
VNPGPAGSYSSAGQPARDASEYADPGTSRLSARSAGQDTFNPGTTKLGTSSSADHDSPNPSTTKLGTGSGSRSYPDNAGSTFAVPRPAGPGTPDTYASPGNPYSPGSSYTSDSPYASPGGPAAPESPYASTRSEGSMYPASSPGGPGTAGSPWASPGTSTPDSPYAGPGTPGSAYAGPSTPGSPYASPGSPYAGPASQYPGAASQYQAPGNAYSPGSPYGAGTPYSPYGGPAGPYSPYGSSASNSTSGFAIASLVLGILGGLGITAVLSVIFGFIGLAKIRNTGQRGKGMAIAGIALSAAWVALLITLGILGAQGQATRSSGGQINKGGSLNVLSLAVGDCFSYPSSQQSINSVTAIPCSQAHDAQVFAQFNVSGSNSNYPTNMTQLASDGCQSRTASLNKSLLTPSMSMKIVYPQDASWITGNRTVNCVMFSPTNLSTSLLNS